jgi:hypothetical protein
MPAACRGSRAEKATSDDFVQKARWIWTPRAASLLRERHTFDFARSAVPAEVGTFRIEFPETEVRCGLRPIVRSRRMEGETYLQMLYGSMPWDRMLEIGLVVLEAFERAMLTEGSFDGFSRLYRFVRRRQVSLEEILRPPLLTPAQRVQFSRLTRQYARDTSSHPHALVHGDLSASNILVDNSTSTIGFIDLEMLHTGMAVTNFAQLWVAVYHRSAMLAQEFLRAYRAGRPETSDVLFAANTRAEVALRCYSDLRVGRKTANLAMESHARFLLYEALEDQSLESICRKGVGRFGP